MKYISRLAENHSKVKFSISLRVMLIIFVEYFMLNKHGHIQWIILCKYEKKTSTQS